MTPFESEENPGVDKLYMTFVQLTSGGGGWPMSVFLTSDLHPFFGATYFPPEDRYGRPGFKTLLTRIAQLWMASPEKIRESGEKMISQLKAYATARPGDTSEQLDPWLIANKTYDHFEASFDSTLGGFGGAPKFPTPVQLQFLLDYHYYRKNDEKAKEDAKQALEMVLFTLKVVL